MYLMSAFGRYGTPPILAWYCCNTFHNFRLARNERITCKTPLFAGVPQRFAPEPYDTCTCKKTFFVVLIFICCKNSLSLFKLR